MNLFFKLKHWQVFLVVATGYIAIMAAPLLATFYDMDMFSLMQWTIPFFLVSYTGYFLWFGVALSGLAGRTKESSYYIFIFLMAYSVVYSIAFFWFMLPEFFQKNMDFFIAKFPLHLLGVAANIYAIWYNAKLLSSIEKEKETGFSDYISEFILLWFLPAGVWVIQPRVQKIYADHLANNAKPPE